MYFFTGIFIVIFLFFFCINYCYRKKIIKKVCSMCPREKCETLDELLAPFGYAYVPSQDIITSRNDAWQRDFGYHALFDKASSYAGMVMDCLPIYFNYRNKTWLIEFWKGQYGISTGCEIGVYYAGRILKKDELTHTLFRCADNEDMLQLSFTLSKDSQAVAQLNDRHWWLTAFLPGCFSHPADLYMHISVTLHSHEMAEAFADGLILAGYRPNEICLCNKTVTFTLAGTIKPCGFFRRLKYGFIQFFNKLGCKIFRLVTRPFCKVGDRILYLYYFLPPAFRKMMRMGKDKKTRVKKGASV